MAGQRTSLPLAGMSRQGSGRGGGEAGCVKIIAAPLLALHLGAFTYIIRQKK